MQPDVAAPRAAKPVDGTRGQLVLDPCDGRGGSLRALVDELVYYALEVCAFPEGPPVDQYEGALLAKVAHHARPAPRIGEHAVPEDGDGGRPRDDLGSELPEFRVDTHNFTVLPVQRNY